MGFSENALQEKCFEGSLLDEERKFSSFVDVHMKRLFMFMPIEIE